MKCWLGCDVEREKQYIGGGEWTWTCPKCKSKMIGTFHPMELERGVSNKKLLKSSSLTNTYGLKAALVMAGRGVGPRRERRPRPAIGPRVTRGRASSSRLSRHISQQRLLTLMERRKAANPQAQ